MKKQKKWLIILGNAIVIYALCFLGHNIFEWMPNKVTSILFPVNESIWEHMKLIFTSYFMWMILQFIFKKYTKSNNLLFTSFITAIINIVIYLVVYLPIYFIFGENMIFTLVWLFISIFITQIISYYLRGQKENKTREIIALILIPISFAIFGYLTYRPLKTELFFDPIEEKYGISTLPTDD